MEGLPKESSELAYAVDGNAFNYISGLSTILVATIQEAKDRISQIEYVFCTQLYPHFQFNPKDLQEKDVEVSCKEKECSCTRQIENLQLEKKHPLEQNHLLQTEKEKLTEEYEEKVKLAEEYEEKVRQQCAKFTSLGCRINELETGIMSKSQEVDEGIELQKKLQYLVQPKESALIDLDRQLRESEMRASMLLADLNSQDRKVKMLQEELRGKTEECDLGKELRANRLEKLESQAMRILKCEQLLSDCNKEKEQLEVSFAQLEKNFGELSKELRRKKVEADEARKMHNELLEQINLSGQVTLRNEKQVEDHEKETEHLLTKIKDLEDKLNKLQHRLGERCSETFEESDLYKKLLQQMESKSAELMAEKKKNRDLFDSYKRLKSQYNFLLRKSGLTEENMSLNKLQDQNISVRHHHNVRPLSEIQTGIPDIPAAVSGVRAAKDEICSDDSMKDGKGVKNAQSHHSYSPASNIRLMWKSPSSPKSDSVAGKKHPASGWRGTRSSECLGGTDPHDDFLDTPQENIKGKLRKIMKEQAGELSFHVLEDRTVNSSDNETQDMNVEHRLREQQMPFETGDKSSFKYVEPVRKKADREKLRGYQCKQCKKFYDALLDKRGKDNIADNDDFHCEHHDGVSKHRYRFAPPMTPEGFWNIGFESEM